MNAATPLIDRLVRPRRYWSPRRQPSPLAPEGGWPMSSIAAGDCASARLAARGIPPSARCATRWHGRPPPTRRSACAVAEICATPSIRPFRRTHDNNPAADTVAIEDEGRHTAVSRAWRARRGVAFNWVSAKPATADRSRSPSASVVRRIASVARLAQRDAGPGRQRSDVRKSDWIRLRRPRHRTLGMRAAGRRRIRPVAGAYHHPAVVEAIHAVRKFFAGNRARLLAAPAGPVATPRQLDRRPRQRAKCAGSSATACGTTTCLFADAGQCPTTATTGRRQRASSAWSADHHRGALVSPVFRLAVPQRHRARGADRGTTILMSNRGRPGRDMAMKCLVASCTRCSACSSHTDRERLRDHGGRLKPSPPSARARDGSARRPHDGDRASPSLMVLGGCANDKPGTLFADTLVLLGQHRLLDCASRATAACC